MPDTKPDMDRKLRLVVELHAEDTIPSSAGIDDIMFLIDGEPHLWEPVGCLICCDNGEEESVSFRHAFEDDRFLCCRCGPLGEVPFVVKRTYEITVGPVFRVGETAMRDSFLIPVSMNRSEIEALLARLLDEAEADEKEGIDE